MYVFVFRRSPRGTVLKTEAVFNQKGPKVASFSSRGPNTLAVDLLKVTYIFLKNSYWLFKTGLTENV